MSPKIQVPIKDIEEKIEIKLSEMIDEKLLDLKKEIARELINGIDIKHLAFLVSEKMPSKDGTILELEKRLEVVEDFVSRIKFGGRDKLHFRLEEKR